MSFLFGKNKEVIQEIELQNEGEYSQSSSSDDIFETDEKIDNSEPEKMSLKKLWRILFFRYSIPQLWKGRKGNLRLSDLNKIPSNMNVENYDERLKVMWENSIRNEKPYLFRTLCKMEWKQLLLAVIVSMIYEVCSLGYPLMASFIVKWLNNTEAKPITGILFVVLALILQLIVSFSQEFSRKWIFCISFRWRNGLIGLIYEKALKLNSAGIEEPGRLVNLMSNDASVFLGHFEYTIYGLTSPPMFIVLFFLIFKNMGSTAWVSLAVFFGFLLFNVFFSFFNGYLYNVFIAKKDKRVTFFNEVMRNVKFIKYNNWEKPMGKRVSVFRKVEELWLYIVGFVRGCFYTTTIEISSLLAISLFLTMVNNNKQMQLSNVITTISLFNSIRIPIRTVGIGASSISAIRVSVKRITDFLMKPELQPMPVKTTNSENAIEMTNVEYIFPNGERAFSCDELKIKKGELVCVLGSVGSGKSSFLLSTLNELEQIGGETVLNGRITYSSQTAWLMNASVRENICFLRDYQKDRYNQCVKDACLTKDIEGLIGGDQYLVAEKGANLSGGQRQRVALARSLYNSQDIMLLDDPLSAVDFKVGSYIFENAINKNLKEKTRIIVTNQTYFIEKADRILVIDDNKLVFNGSLEELKQSNLSASQFVKTLSGTKTKDDDNKEEVSSGDALGTKIREEPKEVGRVAMKTYWEYIKCGYIIPGILTIVSLAGRIAALYYYNLYLTKWGRTIPPGTKLPTGNQEFFDGFVETFGLDAGLVLITEICLVSFCMIASHNLHKKVFGKLMTAKLGFFDVTPLGRIINCFSRDAQQVDYGLPYFCEPLIVNISTIIITSITIINASFYLVILVVVIAIIFVIFYIFTVKPVIEMQRLEGVTRSPMFIHFDQTLLGLSTIRTAGGEEHFKIQLIEKVKNNTMSFYTTKMAKLWYLQRMDWIGMAIIVITTLVMVICKLFSSMDPSTAGTALTNITNIPSTITVFGTSLIEIESIMQSTERILQLNKIKKEEPKEKTKNYEIPPPEWPTRGDIELKEYKFRYRKGLPLVLKGVNAKIEDKEKIGVVGRTGSGKSTLMAGIFRIAEPAYGKIIIDGIDTRTIPLDILRSRMCILPQEATMFSGTIRSNLDPFGQKSDEDMRRVLDLVNCTNSLDDIVLENGENFSMGQRQIICIARALLKGSRILIMDEATANIDIQTDQTIQEMVRENFTECTVITVAHRLQTIMDSDRVMVFDHGELKENDSPCILMDDEETIFHSLVQQSGCPDELKRLAYEANEKMKRQPKKSSSSRPQKTPRDSHTSPSNDNEYSKPKLSISSLITGKKSSQTERKALVENDEFNQNNDLNESPIDLGYIHGDDNQHKSIPRYDENDDSTVSLSSDSETN